MSTAISGTRSDYLSARTVWARLEEVILCSTVRLLTFLFSGRCSEIVARSHINISLRHYSPRPNLQATPSQRRLPHNRRFPLRRLPNQSNRSARFRFSCRLNIPPTHRHLPRRKSRHSHLRPNRRPRRTRLLRSLPWPKTASSSAPRLC